MVVSGTAWPETIANFRRCGAGRRECVVYWTGPVDQAGVVNQIVHPDHSATAGSYELDERWLHQFWVKLGKTNRCVRAQVHTHAFDAFHSKVDDLWPIVHVPGFVSIVVPNFGVRFSRNELYSVEIDTDGKWEQVQLNDVLEETR